MIIQSGIFALMKRIYLLTLWVSMLTMPMAWAQKKSEGIGCADPGTIGGINGGGHAALCAGGI